MMRRGEAAAARLRHVRRQAVSDQLRRLRAGETVYVTAKYRGGKPVRARVRPRVDGEPISGSYVLAIYRRQLCILYAYERDGFRLEGRARQPREVLGIVEESWERSRTP